MNDKRINIFEIQKYANSIDKVKYYLNITKITKKSKIDRQINIKIIRQIDEYRNRQIYI